jgi:hypothetical protein
MFFFSFPAQVRSKLDWSANCYGARYKPTWYWISFWGILPSWVMVVATALLLVSGLEPWTQCKGANRIGWRMPDGIAAFRPFFLFRKIEHRALFFFTTLVRLFIWWRWTRKRGTVNRRVDLCLIFTSHYVIQTRDLYSYEFRITRV